MRLALLAPLLSFGLVATSHTAGAPSNGEVMQEPPPSESPATFILPIEEQARLKVSSPTVATKASVVDVFDRLTDANRIDLGELTVAEVQQLKAREGAIELRERVGLDRALPKPVGFGPAFASGRTLNSGSTVGTGRVDLQRRRTIWTVEIRSRKAEAIRVGLRAQDLPPGAKIFVTDGANQVFGPFGPEADTIWANAVFGPRVFVQVQIPERGRQRLSGEFAIEGIGHLASIETADAAVPGGPPEDFLRAQVAQCQMQPFCRATTPGSSPEEQALETASLGVARIVFKEGSGWYRCSGGLIRGVNGTSKPFFLTAHHCFGSQSSARSMEAYFRYRARCGSAPPSLSSLPRTLGSTLLATSSNTDFTFVQLAQSPPSGSHYFRWTTQDISSSATPVLRVHHPGGKPQYMQASKVRNIGGCSRLPRGRFLYSNPEKGGTQGGSSGSLLFRVGRDGPEVVGQLYGACFANAQSCGYANVDGAFAETYPSIKTYLQQN